MKTMTLAALVAALAFSTAEAAPPKVPPGVGYEGYHATYLGDFWPKEDKYFNDELLWWRVGADAFSGQFWVFDLNDDATITVKIQPTALKAPAEFEHNEVLAIFEADATTDCNPSVCNTFGYDVEAALGWVAFSPNAPLPNRVALKVENLPPGRYIVRVQSVTSATAGKYLGKLTVAQ